LTRDEFESLLDPTSGQLSECGERELRKAVFERGIECDLRATVWPIILNVYPDGLSSKFCCPDTVICKNRIM
jgi:hypothetical protein